MRKLILPLIFFTLGLFVADHFFGIDVSELFQGFGNVLLGIFGGGGR